MKQWVALLTAKPKVLQGLMFLFKESLMKKMTLGRIIFSWDVLVALLSLYVTLRILLGSEIHTLQMSFVLKNCFIFALISFALFSWTRSEQGVSRYITLEKIPGILGCAVLANLFYHPLMLLMGKVPPLTPILNTFLFMTGLLAPRLFLLFWKREEVVKTEFLPKIPVMIIGYNEQIGAYLRTHQKDTQKDFPYHVMGILLHQPLGEDDLPPPVPILGPVEEFVAIVQKLASQGQEPKRLLIAQEVLNHLPLRQLLLKFQGCGILCLRFNISPASHEVTLCPLRLEDLFGKATLDMASKSAWQEVQAMIDSARILITGVQDQVMAQLAHHVAGFYPKHLMVTDPSEHALADLKLRFDQLYPDVRCDYVLASITEEKTFEKIIHDFRPQIVLQGERISHPGLMAGNPLRAVEKNILSPLRMAKDFQKAEGRLYVLVNAQALSPLSQGMEKVVSQAFQELDQASDKKNPTRFLVINSSDVWNNLDSSTAFWEQYIQQGLRITVPSPDAVSCLLSAEEAARMILQAMVTAIRREKTKGHVFRLSGSESGRLLDLIRSFALLKGLIPEIDVKVQFSGQSMVSSSFESPLQSLIPGVNMSLPSEQEGVAQTKAVLDKLPDLMTKGQEHQIIALLEEIGALESKTGDISPLKLAG